MSRLRSIANRDQNDIAIGLGVSYIDQKTPLQLTVDPVTNYLLVDIVANSSGTINTTHRIDQDDRPTAYAWNGTQLVPIATDINGNLLIDTN